MVACIVIASLLSFFSIFAFFGRTFGNDLNIGPNMFDLMFGNDGWKRFDGMTFLFVLQILIMIVAIVGFAIAYKLYSEDIDENKGITVSIFSIILSLIVSIMSFCTLPITEAVDIGAKLGLGPILYSVLHILSIAVLIIGFFVSGSGQTTDEEARARYFETLPKSTDAPEKTYKSSYGEMVYNDQSQKSMKSSKELSENEKADLIIKYKTMLDQGILTQEEFDEKKKQLLK